MGSRATTTVAREQLAATTSSVRLAISANRYATRIPRRYVVCDCQQLPMRASEPSQAKPRQAKPSQAKRCMNCMSWVRCARSARRITYSKVGRPRRSGMRLRRGRRRARTRTHEVRDSQKELVSWPNIAKMLSSASFGCRPLLRLLRSLLLHACNESQQKERAAGPVHFELFRCPSVRLFCSALFFSVRCKKRTVFHSSMARRIVRRCAGET